MWRLSGHYEGIVKEMNCGVQCNVIAPTASALLTDNKYTALLRELALQRKLPCTVSEQDGQTYIEVTGKAAHASRPEEGISATVVLLSLLKECGDPLMNNLYHCFESPYGEPLGICVPNGDATDFTMNLGIFRIKDGECYGEVDARYPYGISSLDCTDQLKANCRLSVSLDYDSPPTINDPDDPYVDTLLTVYREKTGDQSKPFVSGGVSYSKVFGHCVVFGPVGFGEPILAHQADESISLDTCIKALEIYYEAMKRIALL